MFVRFSTKDRSKIFFTLKSGNGAEVKFSLKGISRMVGFITDCRLKKISKFL